MTGERASALLLDLDGTLLHTAPDLIASLNELRRQEDLPPLADGVLASVVSHGSAPMIRRGFGLNPVDTAFEPLRRRFLDLYADRSARLTRPFSGIEGVLETVEAAGLPWGIVTNKPGWLTRPLVEALGLAGRAGCVIAGDDLPRRKPDPAPIHAACRELGVEPGHSVLVGDAERDIEAGRRAGTLTLVALFGYLGAEDRVARWGAHGLVERPEDILRWLALPAPAPARASA